MPESNAKAKPIVKHRYDDEWEEDYIPEYDEAVVR